MENVLAYKPTTWPRCRDRQRVAEIRINGRRRLCAEVCHNGDSDLIVLWPEVYEGRNWRQVGRAFPMPVRAFEAILESYWSLDT